LRRSGKTPRAAKLAVTINKYAFMSRLPPALPRRLFHLQFIY
jgi:hypothetical protein